MIFYQQNLRACNYIIEKQGVTCLSGLVFREGGD